MKKFPKIGSFKDIEFRIKNEWDFVGKDTDGNAIFNHTKPYPIITFVGTPKLHGINAAMVKYKDGYVDFQSRERILSLTSDNTGFYAQFANKLDELSFLFDQYDFDEYIAVYGEWCGGNIQNGVALNKMPKHFVIFAVDVDGEWDVLPNIPEEKSFSLGIYIINVDPVFTEIDFNNIDTSFIDQLTEKTSQQCPWAELFNITGQGEGYVWSTVDRKYVFKTKNNTHKIASKREKPVNMGSSDFEIEFVQNVCNSSRLENVYQSLEDKIGRSPSKAETGEYIRLVIDDILTEEERAIIDNAMNIKNIKTLITGAAKEYFLKEKV